MDSKCKDLHNTGYKCEIGQTYQIVFDKMTINKQREVKIYFCIVSHLIHSIELVKPPMC